MDPATGQLQTKAALDYETKSSYIVTVTASDGDLTDQVNVVISVSNVNEFAPTFRHSSDPQVNVAENNNPDWILSDYMFPTDGDGDEITWSVGGDDAEYFVIRTGTDNSGNPYGTLHFSKVLDYEAPGDADGDNNYEVNVIISDGSLSSSASFTVTVSNVDEAGAVTFDTANPVVGEELTAIVTDPDGGIEVEYWTWLRSEDYDPATKDGNWHYIIGAGSNPYTPTEDDLDHYLRVFVSYIDAQGPEKWVDAITEGPVASSE